MISSIFATAFLSSKLVMSDVPTKKNKFHVRSCYYCRKKPLMERSNMSQDYYSPKYDRPAEWIRSKRTKKNWSWDRILSEGNREGWFEQREDDDDWPLFTMEEWKEYVATKETDDHRVSEMETESIVATLNGRNENDTVLTEDATKSWPLYKNRLKRSGSFTPDSISLIEKACYRALKMLNIDAQQNEPVRGLIVGNVQSGKTANMAGLMALAADNGWNCFIVLSGTIENLRVQTQSRLISDLGSNNGYHNWRAISQPRKASPIEDKLSSIQIKDSTRLLIVSLKVKSRLEGIIDWLCEDIHTANRKLKILVIDDEADQAGVNTADIEADEKSTIHSLISNLVFGRSKTGKALTCAPFHSMNYVCYTATPYANLLNDPGELYPHSFIHTLAVGESYIGPKEIFPVNGTGLDIVRHIPFLNDIKDENLKIEGPDIAEIHAKGSIGRLPASLSEALCWFFCCVAVQRYYKSTKPVTMLIHSSQKQEHHANMAKAVKSWFSSEGTDSLIKKCKDVYKSETTRFGLEAFKTVMFRYPFEINEYPSFDQIESELRSLLIQSDNMSSIMLEDDRTLSYHRGIHLCIDNCARGLEDNIRLVYPETDLDYAPAFIVIGGNTLSRGLTLKGLVCSWFIRTVRTADALMQIGRWFGYRQGYELLPRIWVSPETEEMFKYLTFLDFDLREQILSLQLSTQNPDDYAVTLKKPSISSLKIASANKTQSAVEVDFNYDGVETQTTTFDLSGDTLIKNENTTRTFLNSIGSARKSEFDVVNAYVWYSVSFSSIRDLFLKKFIFSSRCRVFNQIDTLIDWIQKKGYSNWNVILTGNKKGEPWAFSDSDKDKKVFKVGRTFDKKYSSIGVLTAKQDYLADLRREIDLPTHDWEAMLKEKDYFSNWKRYREKSSQTRTPIIVIYCLEQLGKENQSKNIIGIGLVLPGSKTAQRGNYAKRLTIRKNIDIINSAEVGN